MDDTTIPIGGWLCAACNHVVPVRSADGMLLQHRDTARKIGDQEDPWCWDGGMLWNLTARIEPIERPRTPAPDWVMRGVAGEFKGKDLPQVNPRRVREHLWRGIGYRIELPGAFFSEEATPPGEGLQSYAWLAFVTQQLHAFVGSVTAAYRVAKLLHQSRWPEGTAEFPFGMLVRRRLEREAAE